MVYPGSKESCPFAAGTSLRKGSGWAAQQAVMPRCGWRFSSSVFLLLMFPVSATGVVNLTKMDTVTIELGFNPLDVRPSADLRYASTSVLAYCLSLKRRVGAGWPSRRTARCLQRGKCRSYSRRLEHSSNRISS
jgi:hypothetical protein